jgi:hypothetical protein
MSTLAPRDPSPLDPPVAPPAIAAPTISNGTSSYMAIAVAVLSGIAGIIAGLEGGETQAAAAAAVTVLSTLGLLGSKAAQSVAVIRATAKAADPFIEFLQDALVDDDDPEDESLHQPELAVDPQGAPGAPGPLA